VPNKYPAVVPTENGKFLSAVSSLSPSAVRPGIGLHEVIIDTPRHVLSMSNMTTREITDMLAMYRQRLQSLRADAHWTYVQIFKNVGAAAGASLPHSHSQLVAMPFVPPSLVQTLHHSEKYIQQHHRCYWCEHLERELQTGERIVEATEHFVTLCPFVSRFAGEIEIYPKRHESGFDQVNASTLGELAELFRRTIMRLEKIVYWMKDSLAYNIILNMEPLRHDSVELSLHHWPFHWHFSILPSLARAAGFEWGTGLHINPIPPERAALRLRAAM
jgi:UDPglucose--hexose-1-phosphate uridylyltransferase